LGNADDRISHTRSESERRPRPAEGWRRWPARASRPTPNSDKPSGVTRWQTRHDPRCRHRWSQDFFRWRGNAGNGRPRPAARRVFQPRVSSPRHPGADQIQKHPRHPPARGLRCWS